MRYPAAIDLEQETRGFSRWRNISGPFTGCTIDAFQEMDDEATDETVGAALGPPPLPPMPVKKKRGRKSKKELGEPLNN